MEHENRIDNLIGKLATGTITDEELDDLTRWYNDFDDSSATLLTSNGDNAELLKARMYQRLMKQTGLGGPAARPSTKRWLPYAAAAMLIATAGWFIVKAVSDHARIPEVAAGDVQPGGNRATLTLADGRTVPLSEDHTGIAVNAALTYFDGTAIIDGEPLHQPHNSDRQLALATPRGGTYQIVLPDGTQVWLNSASSLKYPNRFDGPERVVELEGEAFFDVSKLREKPFKVVSGGQVVEVLGTQFNISAYRDEAPARTTLVSGHVQVASTANLESPVAIRPGQQAAVREGNIQVAAVDTNQFIAWRQGLFHFEATPLEEMLKQVARWYDVAIVYKKGVPNETFTGKFRRDVSLKGVIDILQLSMIDVTLENKRLIIN